MYITRSVGGRTTREHTARSVRIAPLVSTLNDLCILGDPGLPVDFKSGRESPPGEIVLPGQFQTVAVVRTTK